MTTDDLLKAICCRDYREICQHPWTVYQDGRAYTVATDSMRALFIHDARSPYPAEPHPWALEKMLRTSDQIGESEYHLSRADLLAEVGEGVPVDWGDICHECDGDGHEECDLGHEHDCNYCDGSGSVYGPNSYTWQRAVSLAINVGDEYAIVDTQLLRGIIANLLGDPIHVGIGNGCCVLSSDGWILVIAAMDDAQCGQNIRSIEARHSPIGG